MVTIAVQFYWNYNHYLENKKRVANEIQISLDNAVNNYYSILSKQSFLRVFLLDSENKPLTVFKTKFFDTRDLYKTDSLTVQDSSISRKKSLHSFKYSFKKDFKHPKTTVIVDCLAVKENKFILTKPIDSLKDSDKEFLEKGRIANNRLKLERGMQSVYTALINDKIEFKKLDSLFTAELENKKIQSDFYFTYFINDSLTQSTKTDSLSNLLLFKLANSDYLDQNQKLYVYHSNTTLNVLKKSSIGIFISFLLSLIIISTLFYLLKIIKQQKALAEIKNDLISNITHEFKTPIATVSTAIEAIENFNAINDREKSKKYLNISSSQLQKLNQMVEKLLETATLDSEKLLLKQEPTDIVSFVEKIVNKHKLNTSEKNLIFSTNTDSMMVSADSFHLENAISNLIDNAIKYGGNNIDIQVNKLLSSIQILVADDGSGIEKSQQQKVFDKFYRISKGNTHDVKGFGIGLYYTKKIIEKHGGTITLKSTKQETVFTLTIPNEK